MLIDKNAIVMKQKLAAIRRCPKPSDSLLNARSLVLTFTGRLTMSR